MMKQRGLIALCPWVLVHAVPFAQHCGTIATDRLARSRLLLPRRAVEVSLVLRPATSSRSAKPPARVSRYASRRARVIVTNGAFWGGG